MSLGGTQILFALWGAIFFVLTLSTGVSIALKTKAAVVGFQKQLEFFESRLKAWWCFAGLLCLAMILGRWAILLFWAVVSLQCLREYMSMIQTRISDHHALLWSFYFFFPLNYILLVWGWGLFFVVFIPIGAFIILPLIAILREDTLNLLSRSAQIQWGLMLSVYFLS